jgi:hypothetical protein
MNKITEKYTSTLRNRACIPPSLLLTKPSTSISMDYMSGLPSTKRGNDCVFVVVDSFSKMVILVSWKKSITIEDIAKILFEQVWVHFGIPQTIVSDLDNRFLNTF